MSGLEEKKPEDTLHNGRVELTLVVTDEATGLGIKTTLTNFESEKSFVTEELAEHLWHNHSVDVTDFDIEVGP